jgi:hypothetical protein
MPEARSANFSGVGIDVAIDARGLSEPLSPLVEPGPPSVTRLDRGEHTTQVGEQQIDLCWARAPWIGIGIELRHAVLPDRLVIGRPTEEPSGAGRVSAHGLQTT